MEVLQGPGRGEPLLGDLPRDAQGHPARLAGPENLVGPLGSFIGALPDLHAAEQDIIAEQTGHPGVSWTDQMLYGVLAFAHPGSSPGRSHRRCR